MTTITKTNAVRTALIILAAFITYGLVAGLRATSGVFVSEISDLTGISYGAVSTVATVRNLLFAISCPLWGFLTLRKSHTFILIIGLILTAIGFAGILVFPSYAGLVIFQGISFGIGAGAVCYSVAYAAAAPFLSPKATALFAGILSMAQGTFNIILTPIVQGSSTVDGGFALCLGLIAVALAVIIPFTLIFKWKNHHTETVNSVTTSEYVSVKNILKTMVTSPFFYLMAISFFIYGLCDGEMVNHLFQWATDCLGFTDEWGTVLVMIYGFALIAGPFFGGILASRIANKRLAIAAMFMTWAIITIICYFVVPGNPVAALVFTILLGITISMAVPFHATLIQERVPLKYFAATFSIISSFPILGYAANAFFGGICFDFTNSFAKFDIIILVLAGIISLVYAIAGLRKQKQDKQHRE